MASFVTNGDISVPLSVNLSPDIDLNGMKFSYKHGVFFSPVSQFVNITMPPPVNTTEKTTQYGK